MIAVDTNILVYAHREELPQHSAARARLTALAEADAPWAIRAEAMRDAAATGNLVFDAQLAALCRESGVSALLTEDRDFDRFPGLRTERLLSDARRSHT